MTQVKIQQLPEDLINKIAAGEVIERPASVVKELVENSIDAGARHIKVEIADGGKKLIRVSDDGHGIDPSELPLAVSRHATSKISRFEDLYALHTMGFRGEALASICAVSKVAVSSCVEGQEACEVLVEGGQVIDKRACAHSSGTTVTVKYLFFQTPARLKFLKTKETETSHIVSTVTKLALGHPKVGFELVQSGKTLFSALAGHNLKQRVVSVLGDETAPSLYAFEGKNKILSVHGFVAHPQLSKSQRSSSYFFVNGRSVNDKVLWHAVMEAHRDLLMKGKYPMLVLDVQIDESLVDVNVHPTKSEVRFHQSQAVHEFVYRVLRNKLKEAPWLDELSGSVAANEVPVQERQQSTQSTLRQWGERYFSGQVSEPTTYHPQQPQTTSQAAQVLEPVQKKIEFGKTAYAEMTPIGQLLGTYILCESDGKLVLIDQHAAHERVGFEKLMLQYKEGHITRVKLLIPQTFDLKPSDAAIFQGHLPELSQMGYEIEHFGGQTFVLKEEPELFVGKIDILKFITDIIEDIKETGDAVSLKDRIHHVFATMACHAQIRAHHHLSHDEMVALIQELDHYQFTDFCPHGRPVCVQVRLDEIERWFKRVL